MAVQRESERIRKIDHVTTVAEIDAETETLSTEVTSLQREKEKKEAQQAEDQRTISKQQKNVERYLHKRQVLLQRKNQCNKNIRDLGVLPEEAFVETTASSEKVSPAQSTFCGLPNLRRWLRAAPQAAP